MLAARKKVYTEGIDFTPRKKQVKRIMPKVFPQPAQKLKVLSVVFIVIMVVTACVAINRFTEISRNHGRIMSLEKDLKQRHDATKLLELELTSRKDLSRIEKIATTEIGMKYPDEIQVHYVVFPGTSDNTPTETSEAHLIAESGENIWERIMRLLVP